MMRGLLTLLTLVSVVFFPWPLAALLAILSASLEPLVPLAAGLLADTLYYAPQAQAFPVFTLYGLLCTIIAFFVRSRFRTSIMRE
ncbi:MAG: hypothetical protein KGH56_02450 [Patescibacteria group bacterium]|nr:hypothetical protein [Patescibacteria group bacterium]